MRSTGRVSQRRASSTFPLPVEAQPLRVLYLAAHGGFAGQAVPLGGGAAVCERLLAEWQRMRPFEFELISPAILGKRAPNSRDLVRSSEREYARFCFAFSEAATEVVLRHDPARTAVLVNDVSEGPDFTRLAKAGFRIVTIYHVDVVAYVAAIYGRGLVQPSTLVRWHERLKRSPLRSMIPRMASLVFDKQANSLRYSHAAVVPSESMRALMLDCYPDVPAERIHVVGWGNTEEAPGTDTLCSAAELRAEYGVPKDALVLITLSRISPEKGQDLLLEALAEWERQGDLPERPLWLFLCGEAAYMQGIRFERRLRELAAKLRRIRVVFPGYVIGQRKNAFLALGSLYVFPSRHESYGLTLLEALGAGLPAVCLDHHGARAVMREEFGELVPMGSRRATVERLRAAIARLLRDEEGRARMSEAARRWAMGQRFSDSAATVARLLTGEQRRVTAPVP
jgi:glycosyltransferase involved in cell wall biosynthesis